MNSVARRTTRCPCALSAVGVLVILALSAAGALAEGDWAPPTPSEAGWEWARLDTGEWIKGELIVMRDDVMIFESDKFDELTIDWEDVVDLRLIRPRIFRRSGRRIYTGMGEIRAGLLRIQTSDGEQVELPHEEIVSIVYTSDSELRNWTLRIGAQLAARAGNTDQQDLSTDALISRNTSFTRWENRYTGTFGRVDGDRTANNHRATTQLDVLVTRRFFVRVPSFEFFKDEFQNIDARYTPGLGFGYELIDTARVDYQMTIGAAAQVTQFENGDQDEDAAALVSAELSVDLSRDIDLDAAYRLQLVATDLGKTSHNTSAVLSFEIWDPFEIDVGAYWDRIENPRRDNTGDRPKKDDFRLTVGISLDF